ncbi:uncharacterized protein B0I36DRAFT_368283 [Microdochium trichocladiopsis]|uniref:Uncharacterized protein n=1 Tax=Microdochium trichocladiopsis TaxID=1682393 RepID=A0A9P8XTV2_9PEZI|nr:uncharacterized protein B0I36DRAFT_368283 [Microdochium trichocladiopsis]KAH7018245.1 hypothetical protein B0I36DRAFT_368283 [Microdochium trichocladiopsis]
MAGAQTRPNAFGGQQPGSPERQSSFIGLPPIRRTSTFGGLLGKGEGDDSSIASSDKDIPPVPVVPQNLGPQGQSMQNMNNAGPPQGQQPQQFYQHQQQHFMQQGPPQQYMNGAQPGGPPMGPGSGPNGFMAGRGFSGPGGPSPPQQFGFGRGGPGGPGPQFGQGPPGMPGPSFPPQAGGNPVQKFPPGGQWKLVEAHLSEPLHQPNRNRSPQLPQPSHFAYDKETEPLPPPPSSSGIPQRRNNSSMPPISAQRWPTLFQESGQPGQPGQQGPPGQPGQFDPQGQPIQQQPVEPHKNSLSRTSTNEVPENERGHTRNLSSGLLSKFSRARAGSVSDDKSSVHVVGNDAASVMSAETTDNKEKKGFFNNLARRSTAAVDQITGPSQPPQQQQPSDMPSPDRRRTFFSGGDGQNQSKPKSSLNLMRTATNESTPSQAPVSSGKKRLSGLVLRNLAPGLSKLQDFRVDQMANFHHRGSSNSRVKFRKAVDFLQVAFNRRLGRQVLKACPARVLGGLQDRCLASSSHLVKDRHKTSRLPMDHHKAFSLARAKTLNFDNSRGLVQALVRPQVHSKVVLKPCSNDNSRGPGLCSLSQLVRSKGDFPPSNKASFKGRLEHSKLVRRQTPSRSHPKASSKGPHRKVRSNPSQEARS